MWISCIVEEMFWWLGALVLFWVRKYHRSEHRELVILPLGAVIYCFWLWKCHRAQHRELVTLPLYLGILLAEGLQHRALRYIVLVVLSWLGEYAKVYL